MQYIPYFQTTRYRVQAMVSLAEITPEDRHADLGSGDGRVLIAFARTGILSHGYELDHTLVNLSNDHIKQAGLTDRAIVFAKDFWQEDLSVFSIITVYGMPDIMEPLEKKLHQELKPGSRVLSNFYPFPTWASEKVQDNIYLYKKI